MSFLSDLFEGNFGNLGTDLAHAPSSFAAHPAEWAETAGAIAAVAAPWAIPAIGGALGIGEAAALGGLAEGGIDVAGATAAESGLAADLGIADIGAVAPELAVESGGGFLASDALAFTPGFSDATSGLMSFAPEGGGGDVLGRGGAGGELAGEAGGGELGLGGELGGGLDTAPAAIDTPAGIDPSTASALPKADLNVTQSADPWAGVRGVNDMTGVAAPAAPTWTSQLGDVLSSPWTRLAAGVAPLALTLGMGQQQLPSGARQLQDQATALQQTGLTDLANARAGILNQGQTAQLAKISQDRTNQWRQTLFNQGVQDPSKDARWPQIAAVIDQEVTAATATMIQQNITNALAETGQASTALIAIAQMQMKSDEEFTRNLVNATKSLGLAAGFGRTTTTTTIAG